MLKHLRYATVLSILFLTSCADDITPADLAAKSTCPELLSQHQTMQQAMDQLGELSKTLAALPEDVLKQTVLSLPSGKTSQSIPVLKWIEQMQIFQSKQLSLTYGAMALKRCKRE